MNTDGASELLNSREAAAYLRVRLGTLHAGLHAVSAHNFTGSIAVARVAGFDIVVPISTRFWARRTACI
jgi:hypothetical protein